MLLRVRKKKKKEGRSLFFFKRALLCAARLSLWNVARWRSPRLASPPKERERSCLEFEPTWDRMRCHLSGADFCVYLGPCFYSRFQADSHEGPTNTEKKLSFGRKTSHDVVFFFFLDLMCRHSRFPIVELSSTVCRRLHFLLNCLKQIFL